MDQLAPGARPDLAALVQRALLAYRHGDTASAEQLSLEVLKHAPDQTEALRLLYQIRATAGRSGDAEKLLHRLAELTPNDFQVIGELALLLLNKGSLTEAEIHARNAIRIAPENPQAHNLLGMILTEAHKPQAGEHHYRRVLALSGTRDPILLANLAWNLRNQGRMEEAREFYRESVAVAPSVPQTLLGWARLEEADRQFAAAAEVLDRAEALFPNDPRFLLARAVLLGRTGEYDAALVMLARIAGISGAEGLGAGELFEQGALLDRMGRHDDAFTTFAEARRKVREASGEHYLDQHAEQLIFRLRRFFTAGRLKILPRATLRADAPQPIFILGFPRSGTTLLEQMLSAHPAISAGDELPVIEEITAILPRLFDSPLTYPDALAELWMADHRDGLDILRDHYLRRAQQLGAIRPGARWFTDKMPLNETHLGLIALLFPEAPLIHVLRHPLDVVLSAFANHFTHGFFCSYELETAARHYVRVMDLVEHYRREMTLRYLPIRYEEMVDDPEPGLRRMLGFIGADFDGACLRFHENRRYARTASYAQVTEKLYTRSRFRYRHYLRHLEPVIPTLQPVIERLGYTVA